MLVCTTVSKTAGWYSHIQPYNKLALCKYQLPCGCLQLVQLGKWLIATLRNLNPTMRKSYEVLVSCRDVGKKKYPLIESCETTYSKHVYHHMFVWNSDVFLFFVFFFYKERDHITQKVGNTSREEEAGASSSQPLYLGTLIHSRYSGLRWTKKHFILYFSRHCIMGVHPGRNKPYWGPITTLCCSCHKNIGHLYVFVVCYYYY